MKDSPLFAFGAAFGLHLLLLAAIVFAWQPSAKPLIATGLPITVNLVNHPGGLGPAKSTLPRPTPKPLPQPQASPEPQNKPNPEVLNQTAAAQRPANATAANSTPAANPTPPGPSGTLAANSAQSSAPDYRAAYLNNPKPNYPAIAIRMRAQGRVMILAEVLPSGVAGKVTLEKSSGHASLDRAAIEAVKTWRFVPAMQAGKPTRAEVLIPVDFELK